MALTQDNINQALDQVVNNFTNKHIAMPNGRYQNECTAPITWYLQWLGLPWDLNMHNNRADGWGVSPPYQLTPFFSFEDFNPNRGYPRGTILMWDSPHIAIVLADNPSDNTVVCFEQNADPDGSPCGTHTRILKNQFHACSHAMVPIIEVPVSAPATPPYTITQVDPYKRDVLAGHQKWNLDQPSFDAVANSPILTLNQQTTITVSAELHHHAIPQYTYLLEDPNVPQGYNQLDTVAYVVPAPVYVPPAAPVPVKLAPKVELVTEVPYYENSTNAKTAYKEAGRLKAGTYYQISTDFGMWNLSSDNMKDLQHWVNPKDNVVATPKSPPLPAATPAPAPEPMAVFVPKLSDGDKASFKSFTPDRKPITFVLEYDYLFTDLNGYATRLVDGKYVAKTVQRHMFDEVEFSGSFFHDGREWARVYIADKNGDLGDLDKNVWYACPMLNTFTHTPYITPHDKIYEVNTTPAERLSLKHPTPYDKFIQFGATVDVLYSKLHKTIDGFYRQKHK